MTIAINMDTKTVECKRCDDYHFVCKESPQRPCMAGHLLGEHHWIPCPDCQTEKVVSDCCHQSRTELMRKVMERVKERILGDMVDVIENGEQSGNNADLDKTLRYITSALLKLAEEEGLDVVRKENNA